MTIFPNYIHHIARGITKRYSFISLANEEAVSQRFIVILTYIDKRIPLNFLSSLASLDVLLLLDCNQVTSTSYLAACSRETYQHLETRCMLWLVE